MLYQLSYDSLFNITLRFSLIPLLESFSTHISKRSVRHMFLESFSRPDQMIFLELLILRTLGMTIMCTEFRIFRCSVRAIKTWCFRLFHNKTAFLGAVLSRVMGLETRVNRGKSPWQGLLESNQYSRSQIPMHYRYAKPLYGCGSWNRTNDLKCMGLARYLFSIPL